MRRFVTALAFLVVVSTQAAHAFSVNEAQICADKLLSAYNSKTYPHKLLAVEAIVAKVFGGVYRTFTPKEIALAQAVGEEYIRESFTNPSGAYQYADLVVTSVETTGSGGYRVLGEVTVNSPKGNGRFSFLALTTSAGCKVHQVRVADIMTLIDALKSSIANDVRVRDLY
jgi:ABC-type transporter MlaC component